MTREIRKVLDWEQNYIDIHSLEASHLEELIDTFSIDIRHTPEGKVVATNYSEGTELTGEGNCLSFAIKEWATRFNSLHKEGL